MLLWVTATVAVLAAMAAWLLARRVSRKLEQLTQAYWELRYEQSRLRSQVDRLDPEQQVSSEAEPSPATGVTFVPLSSLKDRG